MVARSSVCYETLNYMSQMVSKHTLNFFMFDIRVTGIMADTHHAVSYSDVQCVTAPVRTGRWWQPALFVSGANVLFVCEKNEGLKWRNSAH